jgi:hypothetical protein
MAIRLKNYKPHDAQIAFHYAINYLYQFVALIAGIRGGKTYAGAREATKQSWEAKGRGVYGIIAPTYQMLDRTTWLEFREAARPFIASENETKKIIILKNGRRVHGHSAENPDRIRNETFCGFWGDEVREWKNFGLMWKILQGRVLSTNGKGFVTTSPNSFDDIHDIFIANRKSNYGVVRFPTYANIYLSREGIDQLAESYDSKFAEQELMGEFVLFQGAVYYTFNREKNAGAEALKWAVYDPQKPIGLCCDFNVDPMAWELVQMNTRTNGTKEVRVFDEIFIHNSNTEQCCNEFKLRYPSHKAGIVLYGDATGKARHTDSNITNWKIIQTMLGHYGITLKVPNKNPAERDRINAVNGLICNSKGDRRVFINPQKCPKLVRDFEQVGYKEGTSQIDKGKDLMLTHPSDSFGYMAETEFSLNKSRYEALKI